MPVDAAEAAPAAGRRRAAGRRLAARVAAVVPALLPGALVVVLGFQAGGFFPAAYSAVACLAAVALALYLTLAARPGSGLTATGATALAGLALLAVWMLVSADWSHAPGRALVEFVRALTYVLVLALCAAPAADRAKLAWGVRGTALGIAVVCGAALATRLAPERWDTGDPGRLSWPITYWNGLGLLAAAGVVLTLHLCASEREPRAVRVLAAAGLPGLACTLYLTLSRGAVAAAAVGLAVYLVVGRPRGLPGALLAVLPACTVALVAAYDASALVDAAATPAALASDGHDLARVLGAATAGAAVLRGLTLWLDAALARVHVRVPRATLAAVAAVAVAAAAVTAVATGAPGYVHAQAKTFLSGASVDERDPRRRLLAISNNGRTQHWRVALRQFDRAPFHGGGAGTFEEAWNRERPTPFHVVDAHSLYLETLGELGVVGLACLLVALGALLAGVAWRAHGPERPLRAAVLAAGLAWAVHAGVDWDWELTAVSVWVFGLAGLAVAAPARERAAALRPTVRLLAGLGCLVLAVQPALLWRSQTRAQDAVRAFVAGDCPATVDAALDSIGAVGARSDPWELLAYCDAGAGEYDLAIRAARAAVARDPGDWQYHYALALVLAAAGRDPRPDAAAALARNPLEPLAQEAVRQLRGNDPRRWRRVAHRLPLNVS